MLEEYLPKGRDEKANGPGLYVPSTDLKAASPQGPHDALGVSAQPAYHSPPFILLPPGPAVRAVGTPMAFHPSVLLSQDCVHGVETVGI
jgi:hypothetical protein